MYSYTCSLMAVCRTVLTLAVSLVAAVAAHGQGVQAPLYRVFLSDGSALASFGEWARVGDRVVFSMPVAAGAADLHLVSLPLQRVDLERSERYADAVRAAHYAAHRGEADFAQLSGAVAQTLNQIALITDPKQRLATADQARRTLAAWPESHFGYRATEVREFLSVLDDVISGLRAQAGLPGFDIALTATTAAPPREALLPAPTHADVAQNLMTASRLVQSPAERMSLLQSLLAFLDRAVEYLPASIAASLRTTALGDLAEEQRIDAAYALLRDTTLVEATRLASRADVRSLELLRQRVGAQDVKLGNRRPEDVAGMLAALDASLDAARKLRLAQDQWLMAESRMRDYRRAISPYVQALVDRRDSLDDIRLQAGPAPQRLLSLVRELENHDRLMRLIDPPPQLDAIHAAFRSAFTLAANAVQLRRDAVQAADLELAKRASAAAAGALMLLDRAREDLKAALEPPLKIAARP
jgi:hypothetical protein